jgi:hypothetical protein
LKESLRRLPTITAIFLAAMVAPRMLNEIQV